MTASFDRLAAALADRYTIERELGAGGMATVYLAHDIKHDRKVAVKVLRPELAAVIGAERFLAEIKTTANLQHPHILPLFDSGAADSFLFYVMPYIEGVSLRDRITREHQLPVSDAVRLASQVASALDYAHRHGIIHRDIKPENILVHDGSALVADFGIALAVSTAGTRMTETGMSLGTPHYMSPEQAMGEREITARSDVYALGCVTYEMLVGEPPFTGPTAQAIIARVMTEDPRSLTGQRRSISPGVENAVLRALEKLPADRYATAAEFAAALEGKSDGPSGITRSRGTGSLAAPAHRVRTLAFGGVAVALALAGGWMMRGWAAKPGPLQPVEFAFRLGNGGQDRAYVAISPDGRRIVQSIVDSAGTGHLAMRDLGSTAIATIPGTEGAEFGEFSHNGTWIAYTRNGKLYKIPVTGGAATVLADSLNSGPGWSYDDTSILYTKSGAGLWRISAAGGPPEQLTTLDTARKEFNHWYPQALPSGRAAIYTSYTTPLARARIEVVEFATRRHTVLVEGAVFGRYAESGHLLYARDGAIFAIAFDPRTLKVKGTAVPVVEDVAWQGPDGHAGFAVSPNGTLVYLKASEWKVDRRVIWADRTGTEQAALPEGGSWTQPRLSPDGRWIAMTQTQPKRDVWLFDRNRNALTQLTHAQSAAFNALWMPDSRSIIYTLEDPVYDLYRISIDASAPEANVLSTPFDKRAMSITHDGRTLAYTESRDRDRLMLMPLAGGSPAPVDDRPTSQRSAAFSPDGSWIAYSETSADEQSQVFVRSVTGRGGRIQLSTDGGSEPRWTKGGREIVYRKGDAMLAVDFQPASGTIGIPVVLFRKADVGGLDVRGTGYDVTPDGARFLLVTPITRPNVQPTHVIVNWFDELQRKVPR